MSAEVQTFIQLHCDGSAFGARSRRCGNVFPLLPEYPDTANALLGLARAARNNGWRVELRSQGLKGMEADALCPIHALAAPADDQGHAKDNQL